MNISPISFFNNNKYLGVGVAANATQKPYVTLSLRAPLTKDTISFGGGEKYLGKRTRDVSYQLACRVSSEAEPVEWKLLETLRDGLKDVVESKAHPDNPIAKGNAGIHGGVKNPQSIIQKALAMKLYNQDEIESIADIIRARVCLRSSTPEDVDKVFKSIEKMVKRGTFKVLELENYRLQPGSGYATQKILDEFETVCASCGQYPEIKSKSIPNGYSAIHLTVEYMNRPVEIQIMGTDMEVVKEIEDFYYKLRCNKHLAQKYKNIEDMMKEKMKGLGDFEMQALERYIKDSYVHARNMAGRPTKKREVTRDFLPFPYFLPQELSYKNLLEMKEKCDDAAKEAKQAKKVKRK